MRGDSQGIGRIEPANGAFEITMDVDFPVTRGIYVGTTGNVRVRMAGGTDLTFNNLAAGIVHPLSIIRVYSGPTTAAGLIGLV